MCACTCASNFYVPKVVRQNGSPDRNLSWKILLFLQSGLKRQGLCVYFGMLR